MNQKQQEDKAAEDAMRGLAEAKEADAMPADLIETLEEVVSILYAEIVVERAMEPPPVK